MKRKQPADNRSLRAAPTEEQKRRMRAARARQQPARDVARGPDEPFEHPPAITLTAGELRAYLQMALNVDRSAERTLLAYFRNCWELGMEPDAFVLREYCDHIFRQALNRFTFDRRGNLAPLLLIGPKRRPRKNIGDQAATHLHVAALLALLRKDGHSDALTRTARAFNLGEKRAEQIAADQKRQLGSLVGELAVAERDSLLEVLERPFAGKSPT